MTAGQNPTSNVDVLADIVTDAFLPVVEAAAREEADVAFAGTYTSSDTALNSTVTLSTDATKPGLGVVSYISNNTDMLTTPSSSQLFSLVPVFDYILRV
jgi:hypothetical protein